MRALLWDKRIIDSHHRGKWILLGPNTYPYGLHISEPRKSAAHDVKCPGKGAVERVLKFYWMCVCTAKCTPSIQCVHPFPKRSQAIASKSTHMSHTYVFAFNWTRSKCSIKLKLLHFWLDFLWFWRGSSLGRHFWR